MPRETRWKRNAMPDASILLLASLNLIYVLLQTKPKSFSLFVSQQFHQFSLLIRLQLHLLRFLLFIDAFWIWCYKVEVLCYSSFHFFDCPKVIVEFFFTFD
ncbi:hypothetical protein E3N88_31959 [Mikania micrantha]|uniref:Uncharacterized protein n=1 Tax=Mikania micrantha TaxID=192012 RepID=A0A5N6M754_9ASTR|nr:hypothetical protein E3N88_31959 [Mikania micrantha]